MASSIQSVEVTVEKCPKVPVMLLHKAKELVTSELSAEVESGSVQIDAQNGGPSHDSDPDDLGEPPDIEFDGDFNGTTEPNEKALVIPKLAELELVDIA